MSIARSARLLLPVIASVVAAFAVNRWALEHPARLAVTSGQVYSISAQTRALLAGLERPVQVTFFNYVRSRAMQDARHLLEQYAAASPLVALTSHDPQLDPAAAERHGVRFAGSAVFVSGARRVVVDSADETAFTNALIRVASDATGLVCFTDGHVESNPFSLQSHDHFEGDAMAEGHSHASGGRPLTLHERHGMGMARNALETLGYRVEQRMLLARPRALEGCTVVVVASPQHAFAAREVAELARALAAGTPALLLLEPGIESGLETLLEGYGVAVAGALVRDPQRHYWTDPATPAVTDYARHRITRQLALSFFPGTTALLPAAGGVPADMVMVALAETSEAARLGDATEPRAHTLVLSATSTTRPVRLVIAGDGDFATNSFFGALGNGQLFLNAVAALAGQDAVIDIAPREYAVAALRLTNAQLRLTFFVTTVLGPAVMLAFAAWVA
ncbi:MAG: Gldg family protein, partial [Gammaproteobacteria bacterium]